MVSPTPRFGMKFSKKIGNVSLFELLFEVGELLMQALHFAIETGHFLFKLGNPFSRPLSAAAGVSRGCHRVRHRLNINFPV